MFWSEPPESLEGAWELVHGEQGGEPLPADWERAARLIVRGDQYKAKVGGRVFRGSYQLDSARKPQQINVTVSEGPWRGRTLLGIYEQDGCRLKVCLAAPGDARPRNFAVANILFIWEAVTEAVCYRGPSTARGVLSSRGDGCAE